MRDPLSRLASLWIGRYARPDPAALAAIGHLAPATVVTGGSEGIGLAIANRFARAGHTVVLVARRRDALEAAAGSIAAGGGFRARVIVLDLTDPGAADRIEAALAAEGLYLDVLVNNAGVGLGGDFIAHTEAEIAALLDLNIRAATLLMRRFLPAMLRRGRGGILNVASLGCFVPGPYQAAYYASKAYLTSLTEGVRWETRGMGVRICVVAPGPARTAFHARMGVDNALYRWLIPAMSPERLARAAVRGYSWGRRVILPGVTAPALAIPLRLLPWTLTVPIVGWLLRPRGETRGAGTDA
jgi:hypothetical protein